MAPYVCVNGLLLILLAGPVLSQGILPQVKEIFEKQGCKQQTQRCIASLESDFRPPCRDVLGAAQCFYRFCTAIRGTEEEKTSADLLVQYAIEQHDCEEITPAKILGHFGQVGLVFRKHGCEAGLRRCTKSLRDIQSYFPLCSQLKVVGQCLFNTCRRIRGTKDENDVQALIIQYASENHICARDNLPEFDGAVGRSTFKVLGKYKEAANTFVKYKCQESIRPCIRSIEENESPTCSDIKEAGQCLFKSCPAISGKQEEKPTADLLVEYAEERYGCVTNASELLRDGNRAPDTLHRSGFTLAALVLITSLVNVFLG